MKINKYICDNCGSVLSDFSTETFEDHISLGLSQWGWVNYSDGNWKYKYKLPKTFLQFCNSKCIGDFFLKKKFQEFIKK